MNDIELWTYYIANYTLSMHTDKPIITNNNLYIYIYTYIYSFLSYLIWDTQ